MNNSLRIFEEPKLGKLEVVIYAGRMYLTQSSFGAVMGRHDGRGVSWLDECQGNLRLSAIDAVAVGLTPSSLPNGERVLHLFADVKKYLKHSSRVRVADKVLRWVKRIEPIMRGASNKLKEADARDQLQESCNKLNEKVETQEGKVSILEGKTSEQDNRIKKLEAGVAYFRNEANFWLDMTVKSDSKLDELEWLQRDVREFMEFCFKDDPRMLGLCNNNCSLETVFRSWCIGYKASLAAK